MSSPGTVDDYIAACSPEVQVVLETIRAIVREVVPPVQEKISYRMPTFTHHGVLLYVGAFKNHVGLFPPVRGDQALQAATLRYKGEKGNLKFPLDEPVPYDLIRRVVRCRLEEHMARRKSR